MKKQIKITITALLLQCLVACGGDNSSEPSQQTNNAPILSVEFTEAVVSETFSSAISIFDADGDALTLSIENQPQWLILDGENQRLSGTPQAGDEGLFSDIILTVSDGTDSTELLFEITVLPGEMATNQPPTVDLVVTSMLVGQYYQFTPQIYDADGDKLTLTLANAPSWLLIDSEQNFLYGTAQPSDEGIYKDIRLMVSDGTDSTELLFEIAVLPIENTTNQPPTIELVVTSMLAGQYYQFIPQIYDADGDKLTLNLANAPSWLLIDSEQSLIYGTAQDIDEGIFENISLTVSDGENTAQVNFDIEVIAPVPLPAMISCE
ncbi:putative Ig domain-containing protein [Thalassotalea fonticola]|uniref:Ig domain-containing protein n=1 Tax=Thalassotalea fonticola TaxID=3065649 RepID=A0ABZ0GLK1_9GAMM|nr:putative Ig domain-containing protein [Colwelliaceae bacterium S1-1]